MIRERPAVSWVEEYLSYRRKLGFQLKIEGAQLLDFARYADKEACDDHLSIDLALRWARLPQNGSRLYWARRLEVVRCFARYLAVFDPLTEVPPKGILGPAHHRTTPHIYSSAEIEMILKACAELKPADGLRPHTYVTLFGLLSCTGLRISEALKLMDADVDLDRGVLTIRETKFHKSRLIPLHPSATDAIRRYAHRRAYLCPIRACETFFVTENGKALPYSTVRWVFLTLSRSLGWNTGNMSPRCRIYDLRHTFATRQITLWQDQGKDVSTLLPALSTYMGHVKVSDTYWYLSAIPELFAVTVEAFERYACSGQGGET
ncbi:MAG: tyrosine-type recombinase/integrase [Syntrophobacteraceae bacterium]